MASEKSTAVAVIEDDALIERYPALAGSDGDSELAELIADNFGEDGISPYDLERIKMPAGGGQAWEVPGLSGTESEKIIEGIIVAWDTPRTYWEKSLDDSDEITPPDCSSDKGVIGEGEFGPGSAQNPSGACKTCPMNQWESADGGKGKACKEQRLLYFLMEDGIMPVTISLPPTSIRPIRQYLFRLASARKPYYAVTTKLSLQKAGSGTLKYSIVEAAMGEPISKEMAQRAKSYGKALVEQTGGNSAGAAKVAAEEYAGATQTGPDAE